MMVNNEKLGNATTGDRPAFLWATLILVAGLRAVGVVLICGLFVTLLCATDFARAGACVPAGAPTSAILEIAGDDEYDINLNGTSVGSCTVPPPR